MNDTISRMAAIEALWKALYEYEDKTEKQFIESNVLDVEDWIQHRIFVQNMSDIDRHTILNLPSAQPEKVLVAEIKVEGEELQRCIDKAVERIKVEAQPEIIRCKDCKWHNGEINQCNAQVCASMYGEDFCSRAERREE